MKRRNFTTLMKKYGYYALAGVLTVAIALTLSFIPTNTPPQKPNEDVVPSETQTIVFGLPLEDAVLIKGFSDTDLQYNTTMEHWEAHKALCLTSQTSTNVLSVLDGVVKSVEGSYEKGTVVVITHADGFESLYASLAENVPVKAGDKVTKGQKIGETSDSAKQEQKDGAHLHFELFKDGSKVDPSNYIEISTTK